MSETTTPPTGITGAQASSVPPYTNWFIFIFILLTLIFFVIKYYFNIELYNKSDYTPIDRFTNTLLPFGIYLFLVFSTQVSESALNLNKKCKNNTGSNVGHAMLYSLWPWLFIFVVTVGLLIFFPRIKKAFSDVIGYLFVSYSVTDIFSKLLYSNIETKEAINKTGSEKELYEKAGEAIMKLVQNKTLFINQIEPETFDKNWDILKPLMKDDSDTLRQDLFNCVIFRDIVGEFCWYIYTGIFVSFIVFYNVSVKGCKKSLSQLKQEFDTNVPPPNSGGEITQYSTFDTNFNNS